MYEIDEVKYTDKKSINGICFACLSSNRKLTSIDYYSDIFLSISNSTVSQGVYICWECVAIVQKIKLFKSRIEEAQRMLAHHLEQKQAKTLISLSGLSVTKIENEILITYNEDDKLDINTVEIENEILITYNEGDIQDFNTVEIELNHTDDECPSIQEDTASDHCLEETKKENKPETKCVEKNKLSHSQIKNPHYRQVYGPNIFKKSLLIKKFQIQEEAVSMWLEKDKASSFYKTCRFKCNSCIEGFNIKEKLDIHYSQCHAESVGPYVCVTCNARFATEVQLSAHALTHLFAHGCARCGFQCYSLRRLNAHIAHTHKQVQCVYCDMCMPNVRSFRKHYRETHSVFVCDHCGKRCKTKQMLEKHIMNSHVSTHKCPSCPRHYKSRGALSKHRAMAHSAGAPEDAYCVRCDKQFDSALVYRRHVLNATAHRHETRRPEKKVQCPECDNSYSRRTYMMNHYQHVHMNQSKHYCQHCDRHFLNRTRYVEHVRYNHEGAQRQKNKLCNVCGRGFATNRTLLNHIRTHSGERPFECSHCSAKFSQKHSMLSHIKYIHLKTKRRPA